MCSLQALGRQEFSYQIFAIKTFKDVHILCSDPLPMVLRSPGSWAISPYLYIIKMKCHLNINHCNRNSRYSLSWYICLLRCYLKRQLLDKNYI